MSLEDCRDDLEWCSRCSICKFIPMEVISGYDFATVCPSIARYNFHSYSAGGKLNMALALLDGDTLAAATHKGVVLLDPSWAMRGFYPTAPRHMATRSGKRANNPASAGVNLSDHADWMVFVTALRI